MFFCWSGLNFDKLHYNSTLILLKTWWKRIYYEISAIPKKKKLCFQLQWSIIRLKRRCRVQQLTPNCQIVCIPDSRTSAANVYTHTYKYTLYTSCVLFIHDLRSCEWVQALLLWMNLYWLYCYVVFDFHFNLKPHADKNKK